MQRCENFIETRNVARFEQAVSAIEREGSEGMLAAYGRTGRGKTEAILNRYANTQDGIFLRVVEDWSQAAMLRELCRLVCGEEPHSADASRKRILHDLGDAPRTLFVDEADRLKIGRLEDLRDIHDITLSPIVLVGEMEMVGLLGGRGRIERRVTQRLEFGPVTEEDVILFTEKAAGLDMKPETAALLVKESKGDFGVVAESYIPQIAEAAKAKEVGVVDVKLAAAVIRKVKQWKS